MKTALILKKTMENLPKRQIDFSILVQLLLYTHRKQTFALPKWFETHYIVARLQCGWLRVSSFLLPVFLLFFFSILADHQ